MWAVVPDLVNVPTLKHGTLLILHHALPVRAGVGSRGIGRVCRCRLVQIMLHDTTDEEGRRRTRPRASLVWVPPRWIARVRGAVRSGWRCDRTPHGPDALSARSLLHAARLLCARCSAAATPARRPDPACAVPVGDSAERVLTPVIAYGKDGTTKVHGVDYKWKCAEATATRHAAKPSRTGPQASCLGRARLVLGLAQESLLRLRSMLRTCTVCVSQTLRFQCVTHARD